LAKTVKIIHVSSRYLFKIFWQCSKQSRYCAEWKSCL